MQSSEMKLDIFQFPPFILVSGRHQISRMFIDPNFSTKHKQDEFL